MISVLFSLSQSLFVCVYARVRLFVCRCAFVQMNTSYPHIDNMCGYALVAVVEHIGGAHGGHYVAYVRFVPVSLSLSLSLSLSPCVCVCV